MGKLISVRGASSFSNCKHTVDGNLKSCVHHLRFCSFSQYLQWFIHLRVAQGFFYQQYHTLFLGTLRDRLGLKTLPAKKRRATSCLYPNGHLHHSEQGASNHLSLTCPFWPIFSPKKPFRLLKHVLTHQETQKTKLCFLEEHLKP